MVTARFDDLRPATRRSFALTSPERIHAAHRPEEVLGVLERAEAEVRAGRWVAGFVAYEAAPALDPAMRTHQPVPDLPLAWFATFPRRHPADDAPTGAYQLGEWVPEVDAAAHHRAVETIRERIRAGDTYQVNHTFRLRAGFEGDPAGLYRDLSRAQACGYGAFLDTGRWVIASASPELFFEWRSGRITSKPMKGTTRRGADLAADATARAGLAASEKDRAENLMIVDMVRNDLGRIARVGSVRVPALFTTEKYDTVWQLTSTVVAEPRPGTDLAGVFGAIFPCASITGAPKVSTMGIITDLEQSPRGVYCGAIGFGGPGPGGEPQWAFNVAIRTVVVDRATATATYGTGGGVTFDSTPAGEHAEALLKARVLARRSADFELLETMRWDPEEGTHLLDRHLTRLSDAASYFDVPLDLAEVRAGIGAAVRGRTAPTRLRLLVSREGSVRVEAADADAGGGPIRLAVDDVPVDPDDPFLRHKTTNRAVYDAAAARHPDADDVVLVNPDGEVTETTIGNLAVRLDGRWVTPPMEAGCLPGTERAELVATGRLVERRITTDDLRRAEAVARINSVRGWEEAALLAPVGS